MKDRVKIFIVIVFVIVTIGSLFVNRKTTTPLKAMFPLQPPLEVNLSVNPDTILVTKKTSDLNSISTTNLTVTLKNNIYWRLTGVKLIVPGGNFSTIETPEVKRDTNFVWQSPDTVFALKDVPSFGVLTATVSAYSIHKNAYTVRVAIIANGGILVSSNPVTFNVR